MEENKAVEFEEMSKIVNEDEFTNPEVEGVVYLGLKNFCWTE